MNEYQVEVCFTAWTVKTVTAKTKAEAIEKACKSFSTYGCTDAVANFSESFVATERVIEEDEPT